MARRRIITVTAQVDLYAVDGHLGTLKEYQDLVAAAHQKHMKIFFDAVPNHVGPKHPWFRIRRCRTGFTGRPSSTSIVLAHARDVLWQTSGREGGQRSVRIAR